MASRILAANEQTFLPNIRFGKAVVPRKCREDLTRAMVLPMANGDVRNSRRIVGGVLIAEGTARRVIGSIQESTTHRTRLDTDAIFQSFEGYPDAAPGTDEVKDTAVSSSEDEAYQRCNMSESSGARVDGGFSFDSLGDGTWYIKPTRPLMRVRYSRLAECDTANTAAVYGHELAHVVDYLDNPLVFAHPLSGAASELLGYHVSATVQCETYQESPFTSMAREVEAWRLANTSPESPFVVTEKDLPSLAALGIL